YYELKDFSVRVEAGQEITLVMNPVREVFQSVEVKSEPSPIDLTQPQSEERLTGTEINDVPYPGTHSLTRAMKLMPGVVEDPTGGLHFSGASKNQVLYTLN